MTDFCCGIFRSRGDRWTRCQAAAAGDELAFIATWRFGVSDTSRELKIELLRGDEIRHCCTVEVPNADDAAIAARLSWRDRTSASSRLTARAWYRDRLIGTATVLVVPASDAQGRQLQHTRTPGPTTRLLIAERMQDLCDNDDG